MVRVLGTTAIILALVCVCARAEFNGYEALSDWNAIANAKTGVVAGLASSYDRSGANVDYNFYELPIGHQTTAVDPVTIVELDGPGVITRFWMPHAAADRGFNVKMTIDGAVHEINTTTDVLLGGSYGYMQSPFVGTQIGGQVSYEPIVFQSSLLIESNNLAGYRHYYQYGYQKLPAGTTVTAYTGTLTGAQQTARGAVTAMVNNVGDNPAGPSGSAVVSSLGPAGVGAAASVSLANLSGNGGYYYNHIAELDGEGHRLWRSPGQYQRTGQAGQDRDHPRPRYPRSGHVRAGGYSSRCGVLRGGHVRHQ